MKYYDRGFLFCNGQLLGESSGGSIEYQGASIPVATMADDLAGCTPVPKSAVISVESFVPATGFDFDAVKKFLSGEFVTGKFQFGGNGLSMQADGWIDPPSISTSATDSTKMSFKIVCQAKPFE